MEYSCARLVSVNGVAFVGVWFRTQFLVDKFIVSCKQPVKGVEGWAEAGVGC